MPKYRETGILSHTGLDTVSDMLENSLANLAPEIAEEADELGGRVVQREAEHGARPRRRGELRADEVLHHRRLLALGGNST